MIIYLRNFTNSKKSRAELEVVSFDNLGEFLDTAHKDEEMSAEDQQIYSHLIDNTRNQCMTGMLLCLDSQQRIVFMLGAVFNLRSTVAAPLLGITSENFRKQLSRAKADLFQFMENKCGLINPNNPCRCHKKTMGFIKEGKVEPTDRKFIPETLETIQSISPQINDELDKLMGNKYLSFFKAQPYEKHDASNALVKSLLFDKEIKNMFHIN